MKTVKTAVILTIIASQGAPAIAKEECSRTWEKDDLKSYKSVQDELELKLGDIKVLQIELCKGTPPFFLVTILHNKTAKVAILKVTAK